MTRQVLAHQPITVEVRSREGGLMFDTPLTIDGTVYSDLDYKDRITKSGHVTSGAGTFTFYAKPGTVVSIAANSPIATDIEPIQAVGVAQRPGGLAAVHPDNTPDVHERSAVSELVSDVSLVGAPPFPLAEEDGGYTAMVGAGTAVVTPPGPPAEETTPDGTTATDPDAVTPPAQSEEQVTPQYEPVADENASHMEPEQVTEVDPPGEK